MSSDTNRKDGFRPEIEGLRGLAILLVVLYHAGLPLSGGFIGVDVFFVISGYLITGLLVRDREQNGSISFGRFYARRIRRLLPAAAVVVVVTLLVADRLASPLDRPSISLDGAAAALSVANIRFALTADYFSPVGSPSPFLHFWSLAVEEQFYLVWPALLAIAAWRRPRLGAGLILCLVFAGSLAACVLVSADSPSTAFYLLPTRGWELAAGGLLAISAGLGARLPSLLLAGWRWALGAAAWAALATLVAAAILLDSSMAYPGALAVIPTGATVLLIAGGSVRFGPGCLLRLAPGCFVGRISYSLYLWHWPVLVFGGLAAGGTLVLTQSLGLVALAVALATLTRALVEEPFRLGRIPLPSRPSRTIAVGLAGILAIAVLGTNLQVSEVGDLTALTDPVGSVATPPTAADDASSSPSTVPGPTSGGSLPSRTPVPTSKTTTLVASKPPPKPPTSFALTSAVRPSLLTARTDYEATWHDGCLGSLSSTVPKPCVYGNKAGTFTVALVGDSHASAFFPAVEAVAIKHGWRLLAFVKVACPFFDMRIYNDMLKREYTECATWNANVITRLRAARSDLVLVANSRWVFPLPGVTQNRFQDGLALARMITQVPGKVTIIDDVPLPSMDVPACLAANPTDVRKCAAPRATALGYGMGAIEKAAAGRTGASVIDLTAAICAGKGACPAVINNVIVYRDQHHLTATFSRTLAPLLDQRLSLVLATP